MYYMKRNSSADACKSLVMIGSMGKEEEFLFSLLPKDYSHCLPLATASWIGLPAAQQYSAAKHGLLGLMRSLDQFAESNNIRTACIHPWFTGTCKISLILNDLCQIIINN
jgi:NAD(P)-dependent dehydrogenase (short-subunit alcohol dehydrogenase family)